MAIILSDKKIADLTQEQKPLPPDYRSRIQLRPKLGHKERELDLDGDPRQKILEAVEFGGCLPEHSSGMSDWELASFERMCKKFEKFLKKLQMKGA